MRLLLCGFLNDYGGAQRMLIMLANALSEKGHEITLFSLSSDNDLKYPVSANVNLEFAPKKSNNKIKKLFDNYKILKSVIKKIAPDLIITFWFQPAYLCAFMGKEISQKTIYSERGDPYDKEYSGVLGIIRKYTFPKMGGFVFQTEGARDYFDVRIQQKSVVIINPCWVDVDQYSHSNSAEKKIVTVGRLHPQKNQKLLIEAVSKLPSDLDDYIVEIYGDGELKNQLQEFINQLHLQNRVFLRGATNDVLNKIKDASLFVLTSDYEGIPNALIEAMSLGLPCISTDCRPGGARALIDDKINGRIVPCQDSDALCNAIIEFLKDPEYASSCGKEAMKIIERTKPDVVFSQWESFFEKKLGAVQ